MPMQIRRTPTPNLAPTNLAEGQLGVEMASVPPRLWVGVPTAIDATGQRLLVPQPQVKQTVTTVAATAPAAPDSGDLWWDTTTSRLMMYDGGNWVGVAVSPSEMMVNYRVFTTSSAYTPPSGLIYAIIECVGGGGGGGAAYGVLGRQCAGGGGGSGGLSRKGFAASDILSSSMMIVIGTGGDGGTTANGANGLDGGQTSFGGVGLIAANGGGGGVFSDSVTQFGDGGGGAPTAVIANAICLSGNPGGNGIGNALPNIMNYCVVGGLGGSIGGGVFTSPNSQNNSGAGGANATSGTGGGGAGAVANNVGWNSFAGAGNGGSGYCTIQEFIG